MKELEYVLPGEIEKRSFEIIGQELEEMHIAIPADEEPVTKRVIHTSADFEYAHTMTYSKNAVQIAKELIANGADIVTDTNMALAGINKKVLARYGGVAHCFMADEEVARIAKKPSGHACHGKYGKGCRNSKACNLCGGKCANGAGFVV